MHPAHLKSFALKSIVVDPELRQVIEKLLPELIDVLDLLVVMRAPRYRKQPIVSHGVCAFGLIALDNP
jgi:hypothetical protein